VITAIQVEDARLAAVWRARPDWHAQAVVLGGYPWERGEVACLNAPAALEGVRQGMTLRQAWQICPGAHFAPVPEREAAEIWAELCFGLHRLTPDVEPLWPDRFLLRLDRVELMHGGLSPAMHRVRGCVAEVMPGAQIRAGMAASRLAALIAADEARPGRARRIRPGEEPVLLRAIPVSRLATVGLPVPPEMLEALTALGLATLGDVAEVGMRAMGQRFGKMGRELARRAAGRDGIALTPWRPPSARGRRLSFEPALEDRAALALALRRLAVEVGERLAGSALGALGFSVRFTFEEGPALTLEQHLRTQARGPEELAPPAVAMAQNPALDRPVTAIALRLLGVGAARGRQLSLLVRHDGVREDVEAAAARLASRHGHPVLARMEPGQKGSLLAERRVRVVPI
jgi:nucleotidyltransferase/DNA polymerase involved in DNA repair